LKLALAVLICLGAGPMARADTPPPPPAAVPGPTSTAAAATPDAAASPSEKAPAPPQGAPASSSAAPSTASTAGESPKPAAAAESPKPAAAADPRVKQLLAQGYRPQMQNGQTLYCRTQEVIGSRLASKRVCGTVDELQSREQNYKDAAQSAQQHQLNPLGN
jgi:hypothetical protein